MPHELKRLVQLRQWREHEALRALSAQRDALRQTEQQREQERLAMQRIEQSARDARDELCGAATPMKAADAQLLLNFAASRRHRAREALLGVRRADAEVAQAQQRVSAAHEAWQQRARAHTKMRHQNDELTRIETAAATRRHEDAIADEHLEGWTARRAAAIPSQETKPHAGFGLAPSPLKGEGWDGGLGVDPAPAFDPHPNPPPARGREPHAGLVSPRTPGAARGLGDA